MKAPMVVGAAVMRELEGMLFPARIIRVSSDGTFVIKYTDDGNIEEGVEEDEMEIDEGAPSLTIEELDELNGESKDDNNDDEGKYDTDDGLGSPIMSRSQLKRPETARATKHTGKTSAMETDSSNAFIINGLESNIAAGKGIKGIRWLRQNPQHK
jgi:hypothetical protein